MAWIRCSSRPQRYSLQNQARHEGDRSPVPGPSRKPLRRHDAARRRPPGPGGGLLRCGRAHRRHHGGRHLTAFAVAIDHASPPPSHVLVICPRAHHHNTI